ncbi:MAG: hypothetical protein KBH23_03250, partial [Bacteroidaceae bacterium]|nr:hypothetical protein [Bacteroidaceae bacterium]
MLSSKVVDGTIRLLSYAENIGTETQLGFTFTLEASGNATYPYFLKNAKLNTYMRLNGSNSWNMDYNASGVSIAATLTDGAYRIKFYNTKAKAEKMLGTDVTSGSSIGIYGDKDASKNPDLYIYDAAEYFAYKATANIAEADISNYKAAFNNAKTAYEALLVIASNDLETIKAASATDYGKWDAAKVEQLKTLMATKTADDYAVDESNARLLELNADIVTLTNFANFQYSFQISNTTTFTGCYRVRSVATGKYLQYNNGWYFSAAAPTQATVMRLYNYNNVSGRYQIQSYEQLAQNNATGYTSGANSFFTANLAGIVNGESSYYICSGGSTDAYRTISYIDPETGAITHVVGKNKMLQGRLFFEPVEASVLASTVVDGNYTVSVNGIAIDGTYAVTDNKITINNEQYPLEQYFNDYYAFGTSNSYTRYNNNAFEVKGASPQPAFRLTPIVSEGDEVKVSSLSNFPTGALAGKTVNASGTIDFSNLATATPNKVKFEDTKELNVTKAGILAGGVSYTRAFNSAATAQVGSTATSPMWQSICLPFDVTSVTVTTPVEGATAATRTLNNSANYWLYELSTNGFLRIEAGNIEANKPYIIAFPYAWTGIPETSYTPDFNVKGNVDFNGEQVTATIPLESVGTGSFKMVNNFKNVPQGSSVYALSEDGTYFGSNVAAVAPYRAYVIVGDASTTEKFYIFNNPTAIETVQQDAASTPAVRVFAVSG